MPVRGVPVIARGAGLSYSDAAAVDGGHVYDMRAMQRVLRFDTDGGTIEVEPGLSVGQLHLVVSRQGWSLPVMPGYPAITVGGCVAFNVHGKGQARDGTFADWVEALAIWHPAFGLEECSRERKPELFGLTVGGMGLTGVIVRVSLRLRRLTGDRVGVRRIPVSHLVEAADVLREEGEKVDHAYSWNDLNRRGRRFGCGVVYSESQRSGFRGLTTRGYRSRFDGTRWRMPWQPPTAFVKVTCRGYALLQRLAPRDSVLSLDRAAFPIVGREAYYAQFGAGGFREYQMLIPGAHWPAAAADLESALEAAGVPVTLGSLKVFRGARHNLSFCGEGVCLALDVPNVMGSLTLFDALDELVTRHGGIVNLSKDSRVPAAVVERTCPAFAHFREGVRARDPERIFASDLSRRIGV